MELENGATWDDFWKATQSDLDWGELEVIAKRLPLKKHPSYAGYLKIERWFRKFWSEEVLRLNLHRSMPQRILDLGTGPAFFPYICRRLGHQVLGLERPGSRSESFHDWLRVGVLSYCITSKRSLPALPLRFDLVTSFHVPFNTDRNTGIDNKRELFGIEEWSFFLDDVRDNVLEPGGRLTLKMNSQPSHTGLRYGDAELMEYFAARGGTPQDPHKYVTFDPLR